MKNKDEKVPKGNNQTMSGLNLTVEEQIGLKREKSSCLLLSSQIALMHEIFKEIDRDHLDIQRRSDFINALRTDTRVADFLNKDAVQLPYSTRTLTLDELLLEIEKDETYEQLHVGKNEEMVNHKEFFTWKEFLNYFYDYQEIEERNRKAAAIAQAKETIKKERATRKTEEEFQREQEQEF